MTAFLPPNLLALFAARPPIPYAPPVDEKSDLPPYQGIAAFVSQFEDPQIAPPPPPATGETKTQKKQRIAQERQERASAIIAEELQRWDPQENVNATGDAYKTLFVAKLSFETTERKLKTEFGQYGPIKRISLVKDKQGKSRGYAFIEYEKEDYMKTAYKQADGKKIDGRRVLVDVERGRTVKGWRPRRLGGGLGATRVGGTSVNQQQIVRDPSNEGGSSRGHDHRGGRDSRDDYDRPSHRESRNDRDQRGGDRGRTSYDGGRRDSRDYHDRDREYHDRDSERSNDYGSHRDRPRERDDERDRDRRRR